MCGIAGGIAKGSFDVHALDRALEAISHRGPDDRGKFCQDGVFMGMVRLSIIDVKGGMQPMFNEDKTVCVVFNGEIYNYKELIPDLKSKGYAFRTACDTEVLVHLYEEYGSGMTEYLRGMFAFAIYDFNKGLLLLGRDRFGKKPLYYMTGPGGQIIFGSELKALKVLSEQVWGRTLHADPQSIYHYLSFGAVPQPKTIYSGVMSVPEASVLEYSGAKVKVDRYWSLDHQEKHTLSYSACQDRITELLRESVALRLRSDVPLGIFLSGGVDSSVVAYEAAQVVGENLQTFTVSVDDEAFDESSVARKTASLLGVKNTVLPLNIDPLHTLQRVVDMYDQPFADPSAIPSMEISSLAQQYVKVVLNGDGGDEVFAGYRRYVAAKLHPQLAWIPRKTAAGISNFFEKRAKDKRRSIAGFLTRFFNGLSLEEGQRYITWTTDMLLEEDKQKLWRGAGMQSSEQMVESLSQKGAKGLDWQLNLDRQLNLLSILLVKMDIASSSASLEARSPLLDHKLAEFVAKCPDRFKVKGNTTKYILRDLYKDKLPEEVIKGKKKGFEIPLEKWLKNDFNELVHDLLLSSNAHLYDYLEPKLVRDIYDRKVLTKKNWAYLVYSFLMLELWLRKNVSPTIDTTL